MTEGTGFSRRTRGKTLAAALSRLLLALSGCLPLAGAAAERCEPEAAHVVSVQGTVEAWRAGQGSWQPVQLNERLCAGDRLRVREYGRAAVRLPTHDTAIRLDQNTAITIPEAQPTSWLDLLRGTLYSISRVPRGLRIRTPFVNASIKGTEFLVQVERGQTRVSVFEGTVTTANAAGSLVVNSGQTAIAARGQAPVLHAVVRPREAVHWALYYPPVLDPRPEDFPSARASVEAYRQGDLAAALARLEELPARLRETRFYTYRASLRLYVGRIEAAQADIARALRLDPHQGAALALQALIAVTQNDPEEARRRAQEAIALDPHSTAPRIALSYAAQAGLDLTQALQALQQAVRLEPTHALAWARLAELWLATGYLDRALEAAAQATRHHPAISRTQTVLGYAYLAQFQVPEAQAAFERAIARDSADPLPRLGLGLANIRQGDLRAGTHEMQKREGLAATELAQAQALDPRDPTPWFYDAIREQTANRPVEALHDLEQAIALNDNRAVYRSRLLLDQDLAARSASLARIYRDLDFEQLARVEGWKSVNTDPSNYSAHRLLADSYRALPRHGIARVSELLQSQLLQPLNITPVQPQFILEDAGPAETSLNEYNPLFLRDRQTFQVSGLVGSQGTYGDELVYAGIGNRLSYSLGQFHYETEGFRSNNDLQLDTYNLFLQASPSYSTSVQAELRYTEAEEGDRGASFFPEDFNATLRQTREIQTARLGFHHAFSPRSDVLASFIYRDVQGSLKATFPIAETSVSLDEEAYLIEGQHQFRSAGLSLISGAGHFSTLDRYENLVFNFFRRAPFTDVEEDGIEHTNAYLYAYLSDLKDVILTLGVSANRYEGTLAERDQLNPKLGITWTPVLGTTLRAAAFRVLEPNLSISQTIEPTQVAGFNQLFGSSTDQVGSSTDPVGIESIENSVRQGIDAWRYGIAVDQKFSSSLYAGAELSKRDLRVPGTVNDEPIENDWHEYLARAYLYLSPHPEFAASVEYQWERFELGEQLTGGTLIREVDTHRVPIGIHVFHPSGVSASIKATLIDQSGLFLSSSPDPLPGADQFWVVDGAVRYRLPRRFGLITLGVNNLFNEEFNFSEIDPTTPTVQHERMIFGRITLAF